MNRPRPSVRSVALVLVLALVACPRPEKMPANDGGEPGSADGGGTDGGGADGGSADGGGADGGGADGGGADGGSADGGGPVHAYSMELTFERTTTLDFFAVATVRDVGVPVTGLVVSFSSSAGTVPNSIGTATSPGVYKARVNAGASGEYRVTASASAVPALTATRTALVFAAVGSRWDQPTRVEGVVNTTGWEDGIFVTRDAEYLFVQYVPISPSCFWGVPAACEWAVGPITAPERPAFIGGDRIAADGRVTNACFGLTPSQLSTTFPPCNYYGFRRQSDGSYREPFRLGFENSSGCLCPVGLNAYPNGDGTAMLLFSFDDPQTYGPSDTGSEFVVAAVTLGQHTNIGTWTGTFGSGFIQNAIYAALPIPHAPLALGVNPYGRVNASNELTQIWFDNEYVPTNRGIWVTNKGPDGGWSTPQRAGAPLSADGGDERMPFFDGTKLTLRRGNNLESLGWTGSSWDPSFQVDLSPDLSPTATSGALVVIGEPTIALDPSTGRDLLFFNYGVWLPDGTVDLNVGFMRARP